MKYPTSKIKWWRDSKYPFKDVHPGYKYFLTLAPCKTDSLGKVLKNQIIRNSQNY